MTGGPLLDCCIDCLEVSKKSSDIYLPRTRIYFFLFSSDLETNYFFFHTMHTLLKQIHSHIPIHSCLSLKGSFLVNS